MWFQLDAGASGFRTKAAPAAASVRSRHRDVADQKQSSKAVRTHLLHEENQRQEDGAAADGHGRKGAAPAEALGEPAAQQRADDGADDCGASGGGAVGGEVGG